MATALKNRLGRGAIISVAVAAALGGVGWWWHADRRAEVVRRTVPARPSLAGRPAGLHTALVEAESRARAGTPSALGHLSALYHANGWLAEARGCYAGLEQLEPRNPKWLHRHATLLAGFGQTEPALARWRRVSELAPEYLPARLRLGELLLKSDQREQARQAYAAALQISPDDPWAQLGLARLWMEAGEWEKARSALEKVVASTNYALGYDLIVTVYERLGVADKAAHVRGRGKASGAYRDLPDPWIDELLEVCFDPYQLALVAGTALRSGQGSRAVVLLERAASLAPDDVSVRFQLGGAYVAQRDARRAREQFEHCTKQAPEFADGWAHLAALHLQAGDAAVAERTVAAGLRHCPDSPGLHLMRARQLNAAGNAPAAIEAYRASLRYRANEAEAHLELATTLFRLERVAEGMAHLQQAVVVEPEHPMALSLLAFSAISSGDEAGARKWMQRVRDQPRVPPEQVQRLLSAFQQRFGKPF